MTVYAIILFLTAAIFAVVGCLIYRGNTNLIHDDHQTNVKDRASYGKAFGKMLGIFPVTFIISGVISLLGDSEGILWLAVAVLVAGLAVGIAGLVKVQKKYNGGLF